MTKKHFRTQKERNELITSIAQAIPVGAENKLWTVELANRLSAEYRDDRTQKAFIKEVERICLELTAADDMDEGELDGLIRLGGRGKRTEYYWSDSASRNYCIDHFTITQPRALALFLVKEHIAELLPSTYLDSLQDDFEQASRKLKLRNINLSDILDYSPFGVTLTQPSVHQLPRDEAMLNIVFNALIEHRALTLTYSSIHAAFDRRPITISPQKLRFLNNQLQLLAYVHEAQTLKHFSLANFIAVEVCPERHYVRAKPSLYESQHQLTVRCHTWVKNTLSNKLFSEQAQHTQITDDVWELTEQVKFPRHFQHNRPDGFYLANYLSMFADSVEVVEPDFVRAEMQRRSNALSALYEAQDQQDPNHIIAASPHNIAEQSK